jgi:DNA-binding transcriptional LysR family regulator
MSLDWTLDQIVVLDAIARTGSFAAAAQELHRVPSAISYSVRTLEEQLAVSLFDRSTRTATWTPEGKRLLERGRVLLKEANALQGLADQLSGGWEAELHVIIDGALPIQPITKCIHSFHDLNIPTRIRLDVEFREGVVHRFEAERATLMIPIGLSGDGDSDGLSLKPLPPLNMLLVVSPEHPLAGRKDCTRESVVDHIEIVVRDSAPLFASTPRRTFMNSRNVMYLSDFHAKRAALLQGAGFGWVPEHLVVNDMKTGLLQTLPVDERFEWTYYPQLACRDEQPLGQAARHFITTLFAHV